MAIYEGKKKVNFFLVGAPKCGTTSMWHYLNQHPDIYLTEKKQEMNFWATKYQRLPHLNKDAYGLHDSKLIYKLSDYENYYKKVKDEKVIGDISPEYMYYADCAYDINQYNPEAKIVFMLRNPVDRAYSAYMHLRKDMTEDMTFIEAFNASKERVEKLNYSSLYDLQGGVIMLIVFNILFPVLVMIKWLSSSLKILYKILRKQWIGYVIFWRFQGLNSIYHGNITNQEYQRKNGRYQYFYFSRRISYG